VRCRTTKSDVSLCGDDLCRSCDDENKAAFKRTKNDAAVTASDLPETGAAARKPDRNKPVKKESQKKQGKTTDSSVASGPLSASATGPVIKCDICSDMFQQERSGMTAEVFVMMLTIVAKTGWVCNSCRYERCDLMSKLQTVIVEMRTNWDTQYKELQSEVQKLRNDYEAYKRAHPEPPVVWPVASVTSAPDPEKKVLAAVHAEMAEKQRRRRNVVISGLQPVDGIQDADLVTSLCESYLPVKPVLVRERCRRLGKPREDKVQPLLVVLNNDESAEELLRSAPRLRRAEDPHVKSAVFINPDLTPSEAQAAYERRTRQRQRRLQDKTANQHRMDASNNIPTLSPVAAVFVPSGIDSTDNSVADPAGQPSV
jgi:hypothetical protein